VSDARLRVVVADDHPLFRQGLRSVIAAAGDMEVAGEAEDGEEAVALVARTRPDVVLMDLRMPRASGVEATRRILAADPGARVLVLTMHEDDDSVFAALRAGARGYLLKGSDEGEVLRAIRAVALGEGIFGPAIAARMAGYFGVRPPEPFPDLTPRERAILTLIARGLGNQAIATELSLSLKTVRNHVSHVFTKLRVPDRAQAILAARAAGLGADAPAARPAGGGPGDGSTR
jgi:DNA-binding NarL/FixJ family response regulator